MRFPKLYNTNQKILNSYNINESNWSLIGILCIILIISPIVGLFLSLLCFRQKSAIFLFVLFSFYFGWFYEPQMDLLNHYIHFKSLIGKSLLEAWNSPSTIHLGKEPYPVLFKYILGKISANPNLFSACACTIYTIVFIYGVLGAIKDLYINKMTLPAWVALGGIIFTVEYNWFLGFRYWTGIFVFIAFYIRYIRTNKKKYLYLSFLCICFHFAHFILCIAVVLNYILKDNFKIRYWIVLLAWVVKYIKIPLTTIMARLSIMDGILKEGYRNDKTLEIVAKRTLYFRNEGNIFYQIRTDILLIGAAITIFFIWKYYDKRFSQYNSKLWGFILIIYSFANFGYDSLIFYDRIYKISVLLLYIYLYMYIMHIQKDLNIRTKLWMSIFSIPPILYAIATIVVSQRDYLWSLQLWFSNFFSNM